MDGERMQDLELWGGHECTVNRVGDRFFDQTVRSGHQERLGDLDLFAGLGVKALRYPVLWERIAPEAPWRCDWRWTDQRLGRLRELGVRPIAGLVHHGSGPAYTSLIDPEFARGLEAFALAVAERYPWISEWTPLNEPLTTARFSSLYGHWHPHLSDERSFWETLLNEIDGVRLAMAAVRQVNPSARLVQTEDLGRTYSTRAVSHQASFDNERRWVSWDLLCGRVQPGHALWSRLVGFGLQPRLEAIAEAPCPPDVIGVNHYLTSDRFLDHRVDRYPPEKRGGNQFMAFADVEAVRVVQPAPDGLEGVLLEAWSRYGIPLAVTESHNGCTRDEQMRWLNEAWDTALCLRRRGVEVEAVTAWSLLGAYDWVSLLTRQDGRYEPGVFDVSSGEPRPTALARLARELANGQPGSHPALSGEGWWRRDVRLEHPPVIRSVETSEPPRRRVRAHTAANAPILITGATGTLGKALARACDWRALDYVLTDRAELPLDDDMAIDQALDLHRPWAVINTAGWVRVDDAERLQDACFAANLEAAVRLAQACGARDLPLVNVSSDLVFNGRGGRAYVESDTPRPLNVYGRSKAEMERRLLQDGGRNLVVRTAAFFSPFDPHNFAAEVVRRLMEGRRMEAAGDLVVSPTYVPDLADAILDLLIDGEAGLWHLASPDAVSWHELGRRIAKAVGLDPAGVRASPWRSLGWAARRPAFAPLASERGALMPPLDDAIGRYARVLEAAGVGGESVKVGAMAY